MSPSSITSESRPLHEPSNLPPSYSAVTPAAETPQPQNKEVSKNDLFWVLAALWSAVFLGSLDGTVVATLISPVGSYFNRSDQASYLGTSYLLSVCCFTPLYGRLADILGRKGAMLLALFFFGSGTILCGLAPSMNVLIAARAVAGMGGGGMMTVSSVAVTDLIPLKRRGLYQGFANILFGLGAGIGGPLGGWMNDVFGWRSAFLFQIPILAFSVIMVTVKVNIPLPEAVRLMPLRTKLRRIDFLGSLTLVLTIVCLLLSLSLKSTEELPWSHPIIWGLLIGSVFWAICFAIVETKVAAYPVLPLRLIRNRTPLAVSVTNFFGSLTAFSMIYNVPLYFSAVRLSSSAGAGLHLLPHSIALSTGSVFAGWLMRRTGKLYRLSLMSALSVLSASVLVALWNENSSTFNLWFDLVPQGFGMASLLTTTLIAMIANVSKEDIAVATGITYLFRTTGQVLGVSLSGTLLQAILTTKLRERITGPGAAEMIEKIRHSTSLIAELPNDLQKAAVESYADGLRVVFICQAAINLCSLISVSFVQENSLPDTLEEQERQYRERENAQRASRGDASESQ